MKITLLSIGKTSNKHLRSACDDYIKRLKNYIGFEEVLLADIPLGNSAAPQVISAKESERLLGKISGDSFVILLDESGLELKSGMLAKMLEDSMLRSVRQVVFIVGGAYGVDESIRKRADKIISLSAMTFTHQMARLIILEQIYRSFTIIKGEKYHHEGKF